MRTHYIWLTILAVVVTMTATESTAQARLRPFWGTTSGQVSFAANGLCAIAPVQTLTTSQGQITHLGVSTLTTTHCASGDGSLALDGHAIFAGANGDQILATYTAHTVAASPQVIVQEGELAINGGTGRFEHAAGRVRFTVYINPVSPPTLESKWPIQFVIAGTISY